MKATPAAPALLTAVLSLVVFPTARGQEPELVTDRPDQTESTAIVPENRIQIEAGATFLREDDGGASAELWQVPGTLVRVGLSERWELRLGWDGWFDATVDLGRASASSDGFGDAALGAKIRLREGGGTSPAIALIAATSVPTGEEPLSSERFDPSARIAVSHDLASGIGIGYNAGIDTASEPAPDGNGHTTLTTGVYTLAAGFPAGERWGLFTEIFGEVPMSAAGGPAHLLDAGVTYLARPHVQLDLAAGVGLSSAAPDWFAGVGLSIRLPR